MKKYFLSICFSLAVLSNSWAATREFSSIEEVEANAASAASRNKEILQQIEKQEDLPQNEEEMKQFIKERLKVVDVSKLAEGERIDKVSSFSKIDEEVSKKSFWEKMYDNALARISGISGVENSSLEKVEYYSLKEEKKNEEYDTQIPIINVKLPNGSSFKAPAYEHIPVFSSQLEVLPNRILKVYENITVVASGDKVKEPLIRFIKKIAPSGKNKINVRLDEVKINGTVFPYELKEQKDYFVLSPVKNFKLPEGIYVFEFRYIIDRHLWDYGDFYELYWDLTGSHFNLFINRALLALKLPGREPAVKRFALTGFAGNLKDKNSVVIDADNNTSGFMNIYPLANGESLHVFLTVPKIDFTPVSGTQKLVWFIEDNGDVLLSLVYLLVVVSSSVLSWFYVRDRLKFKNIGISSPLLARTLWLNKVDKKSVGVVLLDLFRRNILDIQKRENDVILVKKTSHSRHISKFENKLMSYLFTKKDNVFKVKKSTVFENIYNLIKKEADSLVRLLGFKLSGMYILFNIIMLAFVEIGLLLWNENFLLSGILVGVNLLWLITAICYWFADENKTKKAVMYIVALLCLFVSIIALSACLNLCAIIMLIAGFGSALIFIKKMTKIDALLKNAIRSVFEMRNFLLEQKDSINNGRNFAVQQAMIFALDLEQDFENNPKVKNVYKLSEIEDLLEIVY